MRPLALMTAVSQGAGTPHRVTREENWFARRSRVSHTQWRGYVGTWWTRVPGAEQPEERRALRTFRLADESGTLLLHRNLYETPYGAAQPRSQDSLLEANFQYGMQDEMQTPNVLPQESTAAQTGPPAFRHYRLFNLTPNCYIWFAPMLQADPDPPAASAPAAGAPARPPAAALFYEAFFQEGSRRWSVASIWEGASCGLLRTSSIREEDSLADPDGPVDLAALPLSQPRPRLTPDYGSWLGGARLRGTRVEHRVDTDGQLLRYPEAAVEFEPPMAAQEGYSWEFYPDAAYSCRPTELPRRADLAASPHAAGFTLEAGVLLREASGLQRLRIVFDGEGRLEALQADTFLCDSA